MISWLDFFYYSFFGAALLLSVMGVWFTATIPGLDRWSKRFFLRYFIVFMLCCLCSALEAIPRYFPISNAAFYAVLTVESLFLSLPLPMLTLYLLHCRGEDLRKSKLLSAVAALWALYCVLCIVDPFTGLFTIVTSDNRYSRGQFYSLMLLPLLLILLLNLAGTIRGRKQLSRKVFRGFLVAILPMMFALTVHFFVDFFPILDVAYVLSALAMFGLILSDQLEQDRRQQQEIAHQRASIMVLQMRPHFIYNTMTSIYHLCDQDPKLAQQTIRDFTDYLRKNFNAVASDHTIPFSAELEHTRAYLAVEQATYDESLFVTYDTPHTMFRLPPLTLQPIVENAVKHGRDPYAGPFHISIRTRKTETASEITVTDDGRGFDPDAGSEPGIALNNIRQRLELMCGGSMTITPNEGGGTVVTLTIPDVAVE